MWPKHKTKRNEKNHGAGGRRERDSGSTECGGSLARGDRGGEAEEGGTEWGWGGVGEA